MGDAGKLVVICGIDGSGKTTLEESIAKELKERGISVLQTKQPSDSYRKHPYVRSYLDSGSEKISMEALALLSAYDRMEHIETTIVPALANGTWVLCNRYVYSAIAYFSHRGVDKCFVKEINTNVIEPDFAFLTDIPAEKACQRVKARDGDTIKFEEKNVSFMEQVRQTLLDEFPQKFSVLDAQESKEELFRKAMETIENEL
ncbi:hypothetical protein ST37_10035 [Vibrio sp. qd031]|uniref:dTMP kinase n=1 Tax=Vibrio sp. qd031 TaxID=1603038 RepID=UPI000A2419DE|nr:dTMP kinase [Vibrio sp. qd031]ORT50227.1 hypothetical protein ST37_10035 [Vibrio sp. qd031]